MESNLNDLMNAATASLDSFENAKNQRMNFFFHEDALKHLARLTRIFVSAVRSLNMVLVCLNALYFASR